MPMKAIFNHVSELSVITLILASTLLCIAPWTDISFKWWEDHTFILMLGLLGAGLLFFFFNVRRLMIASFGACALLCLVLEERSQAPLQHSEQTDDALVTIAQFELPNIKSYEDENLQLILAAKADIISIQEVDLAALEQVHDFFTCCGYPYYECMQNETRQKAMVVYSRQPFRFVTQVNDPNALGILGEIELTIDHKPQSLSFFSTFLTPTKDEVIYTQLRKRLQNYAHRLHQVEEPLLACGDYQLVSWSRDLQAFRTQAKLKDSRRGFLPTSPHGHFSLFDYPFDHIFYSNHFKCISFETISSTTTSHLGIVGTYQFENQDTVVHVEATSQEF